MKIDFAPICVGKKNRRTLRQNINTLWSHDVTDGLWWCQNTRSEKTVLGDYGEISDRWLFLTNLCVEIACKKENNGLPWITIFCRSWGNSAMTRDFVTFENHYRIISSLVTKIVIHGNPYSILYILHRWPLTKVKFGQSYGENMVIGSSV